MRYRPITKRSHAAGVLVAAASVMALVTACGRRDQPRAQDPASYEQQFAAQNEEAREEFVEETQERISELDREISQIETRIDQESEFVSLSERAQWKDELFELKRQRQDAEARLDRAQSASPEEWQASRDEVSLTIDRLEAGVQTLGNRVGRVFAGEPDADRDREPVRGEEQERMEQERMEPHEGMPHHEQQQGEPYPEQQQQPQQQPLPEGQQQPYEQEFESEPYDE
jgi:hypothetical protein